MKQVQSPSRQVTPVSSLTGKPLQSASVEQPLAPEWHLPCGMSQVVFKADRVRVKYGHPPSVFASVP
jgi:hypothetical protein